MSIMLNKVFWVYLINILILSLLKQMDIEKFAGL